jgi:hypothetical protein
MCGESQTTLFPGPGPGVLLPQILKTIVSQQQPLGSIRVQQQQLRHQQQPGQSIEEEVESQQQLNRDSRLF